MPNPVRKPVDNAILAALQPEEWNRLAPYAESAHLLKGQTLYDYGDVPRYGYFPSSGMLSVLAMSESGLGVQVATISGGEFAGISSLSRVPATSQVVVTIPASGYRIRAESLRQEFQRCATFHTQVFRLVERMLLETAQAVVCHRYHTVRQRLARWLLDSRDCAGRDVFELTQERIAELLAIPRSAISSTAAFFQDRSLIRQRHGRLQIVKRTGLEAMACECYFTLRRSEAVPHIPHAAGPRLGLPSSRRPQSESFGT